MLALHLGIDQNQNDIFAFLRFTAQGIYRRFWRAEAGYFCAIKETGVVGEQAVQAGQLGDQIVLAAPCQARVAMHLDLFRCQPFHAASKTETAADAGEGAEAVAHQRPRAASQGQPLVVVRLAVMHQQTSTSALMKPVIEVGSHVPPGVVLEQF